MVILNLFLSRYITIQTYTFHNIGDPRLQLDEVEVVVYCEGSFAEGEMCPEPTPGEDCDTTPPGISHEHNRKKAAGVSHNYKNEKSKQS